MRLFAAPLNEPDDGGDALRLLSPSGSLVGQTGQAAVLTALPLKAAAAWGSRGFGPGSGLGWTGFDRRTCEQPQLNANTGLDLSVRVSVVFGSLVTEK